MRKLKFFTSLLLSLGYLTTSTTCAPSTDIDTIVNIVPLYNSNSEVMRQSNDQIPISDNSTLAKALVIARKFLVRESQGVASANVELFKRSDNALAKTEKPKKMYSWWMITKKPGPTTVTSTEEEEITEALIPTFPTKPEKIQTTTECNKHMIESKPQQKPDPDSEIPTLAPPTSSTTEMSSTSQPRTRKPRPTKRPPKNKRPSSQNPTSIPTLTSITIISQDDKMTPPPNLPLDPFGVKRKFVDYARSVASSTAVKVAPVARDAARQAAIIALSTAGHLGSLTKNVVEDTYVNLAKRLNATELLEKKNIMTTSVPHRGPHNHDLDLNLGGQHVHDDVSCSGIKKSSHLAIIFGTIGVILMKIVLT